MGVVLIGALAAPGAVVASGAAPVPADDTITTTEDHATVTGNVFANDTDADGDTLTLFLYGPLNASFGVLTIASNGDYEFTPTANASYTNYQTTYRVSDGTSNRQATIHITVTPVNDDPVPAAKVASATEDTQLVVSAATLLAGATDVDTGDAAGLSVTGVSNATGGAAAWASGNATFDPTANACGAGAGGFDYAISDGHGGSGTAHVTVNVTCVNDDPVAIDDSISVTEDAATNVTAAITANDSDADTGAVLTITSAANATGGLVDVTAGVVTFTPSADLCGVGAGSFDYTLSDGVGTPDTAHAVVAISCVADSPVAADDTITVTEDTARDVTDDILDNDSDPDSAFAVTAASGATGGTVDVAAGSAMFHPAADVCGAGAGGFDYTVDDGASTPDTAHAVVDITCVNDAPTTVADTASVAQASGAADYDVLANDSDVEGGTVTLVSASVNAASGTASVVAGMVRFTPAVAFHGSAVVTYTVSDGTATSQGTLTVTVGPDATAPVVTGPTIAFGTGSVNESAQLRISWSAVDAGVGVASYTVQASVNGGAFATIYTGSATSIAKSYPFNKSLVWRVKATDLMGNASDWTTSATRRIVAYQAPGSSSIAYSRSWSTVLSPASSGVGYRFTTTLGRTASLRFTGSSVLYVAPRTSASGYVKVYIDGLLLGRYNLRKASTSLGQIITRATWGSSGSHTIKIVNNQSGKRTSLDAFLVLR